MSPDPPPPAMAATPLPGRFAALLTGLATVLGWNLLLLAGWLAWVLVTSRQQTGWEDLVAIVGALLGMVAFLISAGIGAAAVALLHRRLGWRAAPPSRGRAIGFGTLAAAVGVGLLIVLALIAALVS